MEPDRGGVRKAFRQRAETGERRGWAPLVEARDGRRDRGLRVARVELGRGLVLAARGERVAEALKGEPVQELCARHRVPRPAARRYANCCGGESRSIADGDGKLGTKSGWPGGKFGWSASLARCAEGESGCASDCLPPGLARSCGVAPPRASRTRGGAARASRRDAHGRGAPRRPGCRRARRRRRRRPWRPATRSARRSVPAWARFFCE